MECIIAGDGPEAEKLKLLVKKLGAKRIYFRGRITEEEKKFYQKIGPVSSYLEFHLHDITLTY